MVKILRHLNLAVDCPKEQTCCGQPAFNTGYAEEARTAARHFIEIFESSKAIVCPSGSCVDMIRHHYPALFADDAKWSERALGVSRKTYEFTEYLVDVLGVTDLGASYPGRVTYHDSCHLFRRLKVAAQPRQLLKNVEGLEFVEMKESTRCCGFGGTFSVKYPDLSEAILSDKVDQIIASKVDTVTGCDMSCLMNIQGMLSRRQSGIKVKHIAEILGRF